MRWKNLSRAGVLSVALVVLAPAALAAAALEPPRTGWLAAASHFVEAAWGTIVHHVFGAKEQAAEGDGWPDEPAAAHDVLGDGRESALEGLDPSAQGGPEWDPDGSS